MIYDVKVEETFIQHYYVKASSEEIAKQIIIDKVECGEIDPSDETYGDHELDIDVECETHEWLPDFTEDDEDL